MRTLSTAMLGLALLGAAGLAHAGDGCNVQIKSDDAMRFDLKTVTVPASCAKITIELVHTGKLPANVMGHNVVVTATGDLEAVARDGLKAGAAKEYVPQGDARVLGASSMIGGGEKTRVVIPGDRLTAGGDYSFFCSFPGHSTIMRGKLVVAG